VADVPSGPSLTPPQEIKKLLARCVRVFRMVLTINGEIISLSSINWLVFVMDM
jgi:hypothetical protein